MIPPSAVRLPTSRGGPLFSVVTVCRNAAAEIGRTLDSVAAQTCRDFEYLVIDGASTDGTAEIVRRWAGEGGTRFRLVSEPDRGIYDAMNKGLALANGELVVFLNAGDAFADADTLAAVETAYRRHRRPDVLYGDVWLEHPDGRRELRAYPDLSGRFLWRNTVVHQTIFARRDLFARTGPFDVRYRYCADFDWLLAAWVGGARCVRLGVPTAVFGTGGLTGRAYVMHERFDILRRRLPVTGWAALGTLDAANRLFGDAAGGKKVWAWMRRITG